MSNQARRLACSQRDPRGNGMEMGLCRNLMISGRSEEDFAEDLDLWVEYQGQNGGRNIGLCEGEEINKVKNLSMD